MDLNKKLNKKLKNEIGLIKEWNVNKDNTHVTLHFERQDYISFVHVKKTLAESKFFVCKNSSVHNIALPILEVMEVK